MNNIRNAIRAGNLYQACVQSLIDRDNFKPIFLYEINRYCTHSFICEEIKSVDFLEYEKQKNALLEQAEKCGYPLLEDVDSRSVDDTMNDFLKDLTSHLKEYGLANEKLKNSDDVQV